MTHGYGHDDVCSGEVVIIIICAFYDDQNATSIWRIKTKQHTLHLEIVEEKFLNHSSWTALSN